MGRGYGNGNPKISIQIKGVQPRWKAIYRGDCYLGEILQDKVTKFLESDEVKDYLINYLAANEEYDKTTAELYSKERIARAKYRAEIGKEPKYNNDMQSNEWKNYQVWSDARDMADKKANMEIYGMTDSVEAHIILRREILEKHNVK